MRYYAFGGNTYATRRTIGAWTLPEPGRERILGSKTGVEGESDVVYGVSLLGGAPFLILREHQDAGPPRWYPYTILLDPGEALWERFDWNAGTLAARLLATRDDASAVARQFWKRPEELQPAELAAWLDALPDPTPAPALAPGTERATSESGLAALDELLAASMAASTSLVVNASSLNLDVRPAASDFARALAQVPVAFRLGRGFLVGASAEHGAYYGTPLVLSDNHADGTSLNASPNASPSDHADGSREADGAREKGRTVLAAWQAATAAHPTVAAACVPPTWRSTRPGPELIADLQFLAIPPQLNAQTLAIAFERLRAGMTAPDPFAIAILRVVLDSLEQRPARLQHRESNELVAWAIQTSTTIVPRVYDRLDPAGVREACITARIDADLAPSFLNLPATIVDDLRGALIERSYENAAEQANALLDSNVSNLEARVVACVANAAKKGEPLEGWVKVSRRQDFPPAALNALIKVAEQRLDTRKPASWPRDALRFADNREILALDSQYLATLAIEGLVLSEDQKITEFYRELADERLSSRLSSDVKERVAAHFKQAPHQPFWCALGRLITLLDGFVTEVEPAPDAIKPRLQKVLANLVEARHNGGTPRHRPPRLRAILTVAGNPDQATINKLADAKPPLDVDTSVPDWLEGWKILRPEVLERELLRLHQAQEPNDTLREFVEQHLGQISNATLEEWTSSALFGLGDSTAGEASDASEALTRLLRYTTFAEKLKAAVSHSLLDSELPSGVDASRVLTQRFGDDAELWNALLPLTKEAEQSLGRRLLGNGTSTQLHDCVQDLRSKPPRRDTRFARLLLEALMSSPDGAPARRHLAKTFFFRDERKLREAIEKRLSTPLSTKDE
jgi:hypothetical protein